MRWDTYLPGAFLFVFLVVLALRLIIPTLPGIGIVPLERVLVECQTGDLIAFRHHTIGLTHQFVSQMTHVGIVLRHGPSQTPYIAGTHAAGDVQYLGNPKGGVNMYDLKKRVVGYEGEVYWSKARQPPGVRTLLKSLQQHANVPFDDQYKIRYAMRRFLNAPEDDVNPAMSCSTFVAAVYDRAGMPVVTPDACATPDNLVSASVYFESPRKIIVL